MSLLLSSKVPKVEKELLESFGFLVYFVEASVR